MSKQRRSKGKHKASPQAASPQAFTVTVDINDFSKKTVNLQRDWYHHLKAIIVDVLKSLGIRVAKTTRGDAFWSPGGDGGTLSIITGGAEIAARYALGVAAELKKREFIKKPEIRGKPPEEFEPFEITIGIDRGQVHVGRDVNNSPNVWGNAINDSNRICSTCEPGQILASKGFVNDLREQTDTLNAVIGKLPQRRLGKHGKSFEVVNLYDEKTKAGQFVSGEIPVHVADFEAPFEQMETNYLDHLRDVVENQSGLWTLLLARRLFDLGKLNKLEFNSYVRKVSRDGARDNINSPRDPFFSSFGKVGLQTMMHEGKFQRFPHEGKVCREGDIGNDLYIIARGRLDILVGGTVILTRETGHMVGEMALVEPGSLTLRSGNPTRTAGMTARGAVTLFAIPYDAIRNAAKRGKDVRVAFVTSYCERQKETATKKAVCFQELEPKEIEFIRSEGEIKGILPGKPKNIVCETKYLIVCCHGSVTVQKGLHSRTVRRRVDGSMEAVWVGHLSSSSTERLAINSDVPSEILVLGGEDWNEWIRGSDDLELRLMKGCEERID
jgi:CRP-like cAMP-binding protein/class 3 adenylate cyclase